MFKRHKTKDGDEMFISQMEDSHLTNTINYYLRKVREAKDSLTKSVAIDPFKGALYGIEPEAVRNMAMTAVVNLTAKLYPYLSEAMLRGIDFKEQLQEIYGRTGQEQLSVPRRLLQQPDYDDEHDEEYSDWFAGRCAEGSPRQP